jgi:hypothetical protein
MTTKRKPGRRQARVPGPRTQRPQTPNPALVNEVARPVAWFADGRRMLRFTYAPQGRTQPPRPWSTHDTSVIAIAQMRPEELVGRALAHAANGEALGDHERKIFRELHKAWSHRSKQEMLDAFRLSKRRRRSLNTRLRRYGAVLERHARLMIDQTVSKQIDGLIKERWGLGIRALQGAEAEYGAAVQEEIDRYLSAATTKSLPPEHVDDGLMTAADWPRIYDRASVLEALIDLAAQIEESLGPNR